jgi:N-acetylneuraminic acid mutarotase
VAGRLAAAVLTTHWPGMGVRCGGAHLTSGGGELAMEAIMRTNQRLILALALSGLLAATAVAQAPAPGSGRWTQGAAMPSSRTEVAVAEVDGKIYVVGGFGGERELEIYDPASNQWSRGASFPRAVHHAAAVGVNGKLYVIGGYVHEWVPTNAVYQYDPAGDRWHERSPMPTPRGALAAAVIDNKIHAVGGVGAGRIGRRGNTDAHEVYDPAADKWAPRAALPTPRDHLAVAAAGGRLYAIGGRVDGDYGRNLAANEAYDPASDRWQARAPLPTARSGIAASVLGGRIVVVGGEASTGTFNQVEAYDPASNAWSAYARMPTARHGLGSAVVGGKMYVISGGPTPGASASAANEVLTP